MGKPNFISCGGGREIICMTINQALHLAALSKMEKRWIESIWIFSYNQKWCGMFSFYIMKCICKKPLIVFEKKTQIIHPWGADVLPPHFFAFAWLRRCKDINKKIQQWHNPITIQAMNRIAPYFWFCEQHSPNIKIMFILINGNQCLCNFQHDLLCKCNELHIPGAKTTP